VAIRKTLETVKAQPSARSTLPKSSLGGGGDMIYLSDIVKVAEYSCRADP